MKLDHIIEHLKDKGYKVTEPRKIILDILIKNIDTLLTADELYLMVKLENKKVNRSTVYRNLETLSDADLLYKTVNKQGISKIKLRCTDEHHHHMICDECGKIVIFNDCDKDHYQKFAKKHGFKLTNHILELHGVCEKCQLL